MPQPWLTATGSATTRVVSVKDAKDFMRVEHEADDGLIGALLEAAEQEAQDYSGRQLLTQTYELKRNGFPGQRPTTCRAETWHDIHDIQVPRAPLQSVESIAYTDTSGTSGQSVGTSIYGTVTAWSTGVKDRNIPPGRIELQHDESWPETRDEADSVVVSFTAGYGASSDVPERAKLAIKYMATAWYENRTQGEMPKAAKQMLDGLWTGEY